MIFPSAKNSCSGLVAATALLAGMLSAARPAGACDLCAVYTGTLMQRDHTGVWLAVAEQYSRLGTLRLDGDKVANPHDEWLRSFITQLVVGYRPLPRFGLQINVPLISRAYRRVELGVPVRGNEDGIGDISVTARFAALSHAYGAGVVHLEVLGGIKVPSGDSGRLAEELAEAGEERAEADLATGARADLDGPAHSGQHEEHVSGVHGHDLALGSGSVDGLFGLGLFGTWKRLFFGTNLQYALRGDADFGYEYHDDFMWTGGPGFYPLLDDRYTLGLQFVVSGETKGKDRQAAAVLDDTAITAVYLGPGLSLTWSDSLLADLAVDVPVFQDVSALQIVADVRLRAGLSWRF